MDHDTVIATVTRVVADSLGKDASTITPATTLDELGADSFDMLEIVLALEDELGLGQKLEDADISSVKCVEDAAKLIESL